MGHFLRVALFNDIQSVQDVSALPIQTPYVTQVSWGFFVLTARFANSIIPMMNENQHPLTDEYIDACRHPAIQRLKPQLERSDLVLTETNQVKLASEILNAVAIRNQLIWLPTLDQLLSMLREKALNEPDLRPCPGGWECVLTISEWAADYGTFIGAQRRFVGSDPKQVVLQALQAALGISERWMV